MNQRNHVRTTIALGMLLALATACDEGSGDARDGSDFRNTIIVPIDDFQTGAPAIQLSAVGVAQQTQTGAGILGDTRCEYFSVTDTPFSRPATAEIIGGADGMLVVENGVGVSQAMTLMYGRDENCEPADLDLNLTALAGVDVEFADLDGYGALDLDVAGAVLLVSAEGSSAAPLSVVAGSLHGGPAREEFVGDVDWVHVQEIIIEIQSGGIAPAHDYIVRSLSLALDDDQ
jgi:hypothetical protein